MKYDYYKQSLDSIEEVKFKDLHPDSDYRQYINYVSNSFILGPGRSRTFKAILYLPIIQQSDDDNPFGYLGMYYYLDKNMKYNFNLEHYQDTTVVKKAFDKYQLQDL